MEKLFFSLKVMLIGMGIVFVGLVLLIVSIMLLSYVIRRIEKSKTNKAQTPAMPTNSSTPAAGGGNGAQVARIEETQIDSSVLAAIMAAIVAMEGNGKKLVIRSIKRVSNRWQEAGLRETLGI